MDSHPAAAEFPMMDGARFQELLDDIRAHGQREPITLCDGLVLDGRNRLKACEALGIVPQVKAFQGDPWAYVWSLNGTRRDLVAEQRYLIWRQCLERSDGWHLAQQQIQEAANAKRSTAALEQPRTDRGFAPKPEDRSCNRVLQHLRRRPISGAE